MACLKKLSTTTILVNEVNNIKNPGANDKTVTIKSIVNVGVKVLTSSSAFICISTPGS
ncbi:hypothetical protein X929_03065 [Petrotoga olearia DSM 13574]|uniref:Uncharacterized protein n=1 Tax=Petrotoga olearia DSM 13574 TaxID=1122955 RepID=A0A2K1P3K4_9BACT|nr:hypothetical protein X929_03065 [Petrotoga olearia DSM 13574]